MFVNYIDVLSEYFPDIKAHANGAGFEYEELVLDSEGELPPQSVLDPLCLQMAKDRMWKLIQQERDRRKMNGIKVGTKWYHSDDTSRIQHLGLLMIGANMPPNVQWKTLGGNFVLMTPQLAQQIFLTIAGNDVAIFAAAEKHKALMSSAPNPLNYDYSSGWPLTFGE